MKTFIERLVEFMREIILFGMDAFMVAAAREVAKRFWTRLSERGGAIASLEEGEQRRPFISAHSGGGGNQMSFLDEYRD